MLSSAEVSASLPSRCIKLVLFGASRFYTFTLPVFKMHQNTAICFFVRQFGVATWAAGTLQCESL